MSGKEKTFNQSDLIAMGWTKTMISKLLPEPILKPNPMYRSAAPMKTWRETDVLAIMETPEYSKLYQKAQQRKQVAQKAVNTKKEQTNKILEEMEKEIRVKIISDTDLVFQTISAKQNWYAYQAVIREDCDCYHQKLENVDGETLNRWVVNYIRHNLVSYDDSLEKIKGKVGKNNAYFSYKETVLRAIARAYPKYAEECERQIAESM